MNKETEIFIKKVENKFPSQVSFNKTIYIDYDTPVIITCPKHGDISITPKNLLKKNRKNACRQCSIIQRAERQILSKDDFFKNLYKRYPNIDYDFSKSNYTKTEEKIEVICHKKDINGNEHGSWYTEPEKLYQGYGCPKCALEVKKKKLMRTYEEYKKLLNDSYGDIYEIDKESFDDNTDELKLLCKKHNRYFTVSKIGKIFNNNHKCPECIQDDMLIKEDEMFSIEEEYWVDVLGYEGKYKCSSLGRFKRIIKDKNGKIIKEQIKSISFNNRYGLVTLCGKPFLAHRKIYESFHHIKLKKGMSQTIDHIDNNPRNNKISNLRLAGSIKNNVNNNKKTLMKLSRMHKKEVKKRNYDFETLDGEQWINAIDYENFYMVSNYGRVLAKERIIVEKTGKVYKRRPFLMHPNKTHGDYLIIQLKNENRISKTLCVHKLVYESFNGRIKEGNQIDHLDGNVLNNNLSNLKEVTRSENMKNANTIAKIRKNNKSIKVQKLNLNGDVIEEYNSLKEASLKNNIWSMRAVLNSKQIRNRKKGFYFVEKSENKDYE